MEPVSLKMCFINITSPSSKENAYKSFKTTVGMELDWADSKKGNFRH